MLLGAHMSIAKAPYLAITRGKKIDSETIQIFVKSNRRWNAKPMSQKKIDEFIETRKKSNINPIFSHNTYLVNLASTDEKTLQKSIKCFRYEILTSEKLGLEYIVMHPGSHLGDGEEKGIKKISSNLRKLILDTEEAKIKILIETTAGQGTNIGYKFDQIKKILDQVDVEERTGVCLDTCHIFASGYDFRTEKDYNKMIDELNSLFGLEQISAVHLNDSVGELGSRLDRHEHIGKGKIGLDGFKNFLLDKRFENIPGVLETPKSKDLSMDKRNIDILRSLEE
ncbi:MAG: deoxyribonuclease IV [Candidatus Lokiarchaeota archaeon]|nr:deoxyribonuclease IV [Candidatus Lokiarchaeota archaeon]